MRRQYLSLKNEYSDCILFFRLGDFYETFDDDAKIVANVCDVVLTSRPVGNDQRAAAGRRAVSQCRRLYCAPGRGRLSGSDRRASKRTRDAAWLSVRCGGL